ncbi:PepSY domain-containing protein [Ciceribacter sp. L1K23]|uniref:PepSY domain-containing protein n=1 Tax=Ciceribacter sp. L1K23 TaxID=2820276 RepID=UPI001B82676A|nr:PepSY domain-containing protein [Ciceribacter sp. L1K23]MBR0554720.1 PepSY domain-containing protein [Ciceribacter sp. L1K23]
MIRTRREFLIRSVALVGALASTGIAVADDDDRDHDHDEDDRQRDRLREKVARGEVKSLAELRRIVANRVEGKIVDTQFDLEDDRAVYEFRVLRSDGRLVEVEVDAATGSILEIEND